MPVQVRKPRGPFAPLAMRLILIKKPPQAAARARVAERHANRKDRRARLDPRTLVSADHVILLTSLPGRCLPGRTHRRAVSAALPNRARVQATEVDPAHGSSAKDECLASIWRIITVLAAAPPNVPNLAPSLALRQMAGSSPAMTEGKRWFQMRLVRSPAFRPFDRAAIAWQDRGRTK